MIIDNGVVKSTTPGINYYQDPDFQVYYQGLIYFPYQTCGNESIKTLLANLKNNRISNITDIKGHYFIFIIDKKTGWKYFFVDNSAVVSIFIHNNVLSTSLLELAKYLQMNTSHLDFKGIVDFLHFGFVYRGKTFFKGVRRLDKNELILYNPQHEQIIQSKGLPKISEPIDLDILDFFRGFHEAVKTKKLSLDLTGGFDTRLIVSMLHYLNADFELAISGKEGHIDVELSRVIADTLKRDLFITYHDVEDLTDESLKELFYLSDAQIDIVGYHRRNQLTQQRKKRGAEIQLSGGGADFVKDIGWLHDFPFYHKKNPNIKRLYDLRMESVAYPHHQLGPETITISRELRQDIIKHLYKYRMETNTRTYDNIAYCYKQIPKVGAYASIENRTLDSYVPLAELDLARFGFNMKRRKRFFNNFHRDTITTYCPPISKLKTTEGGISASAVLSDKLKDLTRYVLDKQKRLAKQILRKLLKKTYFQPNPDDLRVFKKAASLEIFKEQIPLLKDMGIISKDFQVENIRNGDIGKFLVLGLLIREL